MGWSLAMVVGSNGPLDAAALARGPDAAATSALLDTLGLPQGEPAEDGTIFDAICSGSDDLFAGSYGDGFALLQESGLVDGFFEPAPAGWRRLFAKSPAVPSHVAALIDLSHRQPLFVAVLQSSSNLWGYALVENGKTVRRVAGGVLNPVLVDEGEPTPEELAIRGGRPIGDVTISGDGEEIVLQVAARFLGDRLDQAEAFLEAPILQFG